MKIIKTGQTTSLTPYEDNEPLPKGFFFSDTWYLIRYIASIVIKIVLVTVILFLWMVFLTAIQPN